MNTECQPQHKNTQWDHWIGCNAINMPVAVNTNKRINSVIQDISRFGILRNFIRVQEIEKKAKNKKSSDLCRQKHMYLLLMMMMTVMTTMRTTMTTTTRKDDNDDDDDDDDNDVSMEQKAD